MELAKAFFVFYRRGLFSLLRKRKPFNKIFETSGLNTKACSLDFLPVFARSIICIEEEYSSVCLADAVGEGYIGKRQNCVCSSSTKGIKSPESPRKPRVRAF
jgi:hypothetical protein